MLDTNSVFLNLLKFDLWPKMQSIVEKVPCALEKKVYSSAFECWCVWYCPRGLWDYPQFFPFFLLYSALHKLFPPFIFQLTDFFLLLQIFCFWFLLECSGTPLQYSCLENPMDGGAWWAAVRGVARSRTRLSNFTFCFHFHALEKEMATHSSVLALMW